MRDRVRHEKRIGTVVDGKWRIDTLLGWGSTSAVYAATHRNGHRAALKILHQALCADRAVCDRFLQEAGIANAIKHRSIVPIGDDGVTEDGCAFLVLELLEGETLEARCERKGGTIPLEDLAPIAEELMSALAAVHAAGVIHRDLKPQNVFLTRKELKLLDFGTARIFDRPIGSSASVQGLVIGTPSFMAPEQARGARSEIDAQSDVWALGATLFTSLSGQFVHLGRDAHQRLLAAASKPARKLADAAPSVDPRVAEVIDRALAFTKEERFADVQAMRVAFRTAVLASVPTMRDLKAYADVLAEGRVASIPAPRPATAPPRPGSVRPAGALQSGASRAFSLPPAARIPAEALLPVAGGSEGEADEVAAQDESAPEVFAVLPVSAPLEVPTAGVFSVPAASPSDTETLAVSATQSSLLPIAQTRRPYLAIAGCLAAAAVVALALFGVGGDERGPRASAPAAPEEPSSPAAAAAPAPSFIVISAPDDPTLPAASPQARPVARPVAATVGAAVTDAGIASTKDGGGIIRTWDEEPSVPPAIVAPVSPGVTAAPAPVSSPPPEVTTPSTPLVPVPAAPPAEAPPPAMAPPAAPVAAPSQASLPVVAPTVD